MRPAGSPPTEAALHEAALRYLARYGTTVANLTRVLDRRVERWARATHAEPETVAAGRAAARAVVARLAASGAVDDAAFATSRARSLSRAGRSRLAVAAHLAARGVAPAAAASALPRDPDHELAVAASFIRRRRIGAFRGAAGDPSKELGMLARGGFARDVATRVLALDAEMADALIKTLRQP